MTRDEIIQKVKGLIAFQFGKSFDNIKLEDNLRTDWNADSLDFIEIVMELEDELGTGRIPDHKAEQWRTVGDIVDYVEKKLKE